jgi:TolA-binding protein
MKKILSSVIFLSLILSTSACLKTRAQLREDSEDSKPIPVQPAQEVKPQGQYVIDEIKAEITQQQGRIEDLERNQKEVMSGAKSGDELKKLESRLEQLEESQKHLQEALNKIHESAALKDPDTLFKKAKTQYDGADYEAAAETFGQYQKIQKAKKLDEAAFYRGESYFKLKQYKKAIVEYSKFPEKFTHSSRMPEALYKIGLSFEALGMKEDAKGFYQELVEKYPKSPEAKKAKKKAK